MKKISKVLIAVFLIVSFAMNLASCGSSANSSNESNKTSGVNEKKETQSSNTSKDLYILNFNDYLSEEALKIFEEETGITVHEDKFESNEDVLPKIESGVSYDLICISDYCIETMIEKNLLLPIDKSKIPNISNINKDKLKSLSVCDPGNTYAVPYFCGTMGIIFNKEKLDAKNITYPTKWADLFNPALKGELLMQSSVRDLYTVALKKNGFSVNSKNKDEIDKCTEEFIKQKPYVEGYFVDEIKDKIASGNAGIAPITSGDVQLVYEKDASDNQEKYCFIIPEEGTQIFIDAWCIVKNAENVDNAHKFIDYMCREDIAKLNSEYVGYESVNDKASDDEFLVMKQIDGAYIDYSNGNFEQERNVADAIQYYIDGLLSIQGAN